MSRHHVLAGLVLGALLGACVSIPDPNHCWRREGDATCRALFGDGAVCSPCLRGYNGCIDASEAPDCEADAESSSSGSEG